NAKDVVGKTVLHHCAKNNYLRAATFLLEHGADVNIDSRTPADRTSSGCGCGNASGLKSLLGFLTGRQDNDNEQFQAGMTPLHYAADHGNLELIKLLISKGAKVDAFDRDSGTPLHRASQSGLDTVKLLLQQEGTESCLKVADRYGYLPLHNAVAYG
ncbi:ankyrin, partial [Lindgomyces ingoldianus]